MNRSQSRRYEVLLKVRDFGINHRQQFPESSPASKAFMVVGDAAAEIEAHATAKLLTREEGKQARAAVRQAIDERLKIVARTARIVARSAPGADSVFKYPAKKSGVAIVTAARAFIREGQTAVERFVPFGMPATTITELQELVDRYELADRERRAGKTGFAAARAGTTAALATATDALRVLDVVVPNTLAASPALLAGWRDARRVDARPKETRAIVKPAVTVTEGKTTKDGSNNAGATAAAPSTDAASVAAESDEVLRRVS